MNGFKTFLLMMVMTFLLMVVGGLIGGKTGVIIALAVAGIGNFISYFFSDKLVLKAYNAKELPAGHRITELVRRLSSQGNLPMPKVYMINQDQPNAFATGRNPVNAVVAVTRGLANNMNDNELSGVLSHELGHVAHRDILIGSIAATMAGAISFLAYSARFSVGGRNNRQVNPIILLAAAILAPLAASLVRMAISRSGEFKADEYGAKLSGNPLYLSSALSKLENWSKQIPMNGNPSTSSMFIVNPFSGKQFARLFSTHPPTSERIKRLNAMTGRGYKK
ncbi:MAG: zinc metalloprotease HtpX [Prolixibacteraceae bacterium]|nr:zinc metalloprotease HtpX [Prolixibacteraceae bacterium]